MANESQSETATNLQRIELSETDAGPIEPKFRVGYVIGCALQE